MCGIAGVVSTAADQRIEAATIHRMCQAIVHRGPDDEGIFVKDGTGFGMRRLSIIDLAGGHQPVFNEDRSVWVVFNGEIYNFPELRGELEKRGHRFYTHTDTEVIVHLYEDLGADCVNKLRGMFAFALYDERRGKLVMARDRLGKKPLHYALAGDRLLFGSEIKSILAVAPELASVNNEALLQYMYFGYIPDPITSFLPIQKLPPGHLLEFEAGQVQVRQYWDLPEYGAHQPRSEEECLEELEWRLAEAVRIRLISDVPLGALLSGGTDSSTVVALMARASSKPVKTFSIGFSHDDFNEAHYARIVAKHFGTEHHELVLEPDVLETVETLTSSLEEPFGDSSMLPTYYVSCMARKHVTVALSGDGGDEIFAGYDRYGIHLRRQVFERIPPWAWRMYRERVYPRLPQNMRGRKLSYNVSLPWRERYVDGISFVPSFERDMPLLSNQFREVLRTGCNPEKVMYRYFDQAPAKDPVSQMLYVDTKTYMVADILTKVDRMSMAASLEVRVPILDHLFVEWATGLPAEWKLRGGQQKYILRKLAERVGVPREALYRPKQGFAMPLVHWIRNELKDLIMSVLLEPRTLQRGYFNPEGIRRLLDEHFRERRDRSGRIWRLLIFELWHRNFLERIRTTEWGAEPYRVNNAAGEPRMSSLKDNGIKPEPDQPAASQTNSPLPFSGSPGAIFLMTNSLETGGTERQFVEIARSLRKDGFQVHLGCLQKKGPFLEGLGELHLSELGGSLYGLRSIRSRWQLMRDLREKNVAVAHAFDFYANLMLIPAAKLARVPVVIGSHPQLGDLLTPAKFHAQLTMFRWCDRVVCNSRAAADRLLHAGLPERKVAVIGNALPPEAFAESVPALPRVAGILRVAMIARMNAAYKNHRGFLRAAAQLSRRLSNVEFLLIGDGPLRQELEHEATELGLQGRVQFLGDRRDIAAVLASVDVSTVPSASESLSNVMLESMAAGVPVVATDVGGNGELASDGRAVLVAPNDAEALAAGLERALADPELRSSISSRAREFARASFSVERIRAQYCELYAEVLGRKNKRNTLQRQTRVEAAAGPRIRVAFVAPSLRYVGGQAVQASLLMRNWEKDPEVEACFVPVDPRLPYGLGWVERVPFLRTIIREPLYLFTLWHHLKEVEIAHIFSASYSSFLLAPLPAWFVARLRGKRTVINYRSGECRDHLQRSAITRRVLKGTDRLVVPSGYLVDVLREFGLEAQVVPNLVDLSQFRYRLRRPLRPHLVCTRGFHPYYGVDVAVRAFAEVQKSYPEAQIDLVGGGALEGEIRDLVRQLNLSGVNFLGVASHKDIGRFYDRADIFVNASNLDNMPVSVLEAFASGTPVVTTAPESMRYIVDHGSTGLLSEPGDAAALAQNILRVLGDSELATRLAQNAFAESSRYSWKSVRDQWLMVYLALVPRCGKPEEALVRRV